MDCLKCGANFEGERCPYCGWIPEKKETPSIQIPNITIVNNVSNEQHMQTGRAERKQKSSQKNKGMAMFLACLGFLGIGGLNRFYVGKTTSGVVYLLTIGLCWIGTIYDIVQIKNGNFTDKDGLPLIK